MDKGELTRVPDSTVPAPMQAASPSDKERRDRLVDRTLTGVAVALLIAVLAVAGVFGYTYYQTTVLSRNALPGYRTVVQMEGYVRQEPNNAGLRVRLGEAYAAAGMYEDSVTQLKAAVKIDSKHTGAYLDMGIVALIQGDLASARKHFEKVKELTEGTEFSGLNQRREQAFFYLGQIDLKNGDYEEAVSNFKESLRMRRDASDTYYNLALAYIGLDELDGAIDNLLIALQFDPQYVDAQYELGKAYLTKGEKAAAASQFRAALNERPESDQLAEALAGLGPAEERFAAAKKAAAAGDDQTALSEASIGYAVDPANRTGALLFAGLLEEAGKPTSALNVYEALVTRDPADKSSAAAVERLKKQIAASAKKTKKAK